MRCAARLVPSRRLRAVAVAARAVRGAALVRAGGAVETAEAVTASRGAETVIWRSQRAVSG